jgi:hypothetical protein
MLDDWVVSVDEYCEEVDIFVLLDDRVLSVEE